MKILTDEEIKNVFLETFVDDSVLTEAEWTAARAFEAAEPSHMAMSQPVDMARVLAERVTKLEQQVTYLMRRIDEVRE